MNDVSQTIAIFGDVHGHQDLMVRTALRWQEEHHPPAPAGPPDVASLKVPFFWPFSGAYHVITLDRDGYNYAKRTLRRGGRVVLLVGNIWPCQRQ